MTGDVKLEEILIHTIAGMLAGLRHVAEIGRAHV